MNLWNWQRTRGRHAFRARCQRLVWTVFLTVLSTASLAADSAPATLSGEQVIAQLVAMDARRNESRRGYTATRHYTVDYKGFPSDKHAEMTVSVVSAPSGRKEFTITSESGSKLLLTRVLHKLVESEMEANDAVTRRQLALTPDNYNFRLVGNETVEGRLCYVFEVEPKKKSKFLYEGKIWVDAQDFAVAQISAKPAKNPSFWISSVQVEHRFAKHGDAWLPYSNRSRSKVRLGGLALLAIDYEHYEFTPDAGKGSASR